jgi:hypothetical protein
MQQGNRVVVIAKAHGLTGLQRIQRAKNGRMTKTFGHTAGIERVNGFRGHVTGGA